MEVLPPAHDRESIGFLSFHLDRRGGRLTRAGESIPLRPKTWAVLLYLAERPGVLVTREELLDAVWPNVAITPDTLTKSIGELRVALGDDSRTPRCIETVHRRGFRFVAKISRQPASEPVVFQGESTAASPQPFVGRLAELRELERLWVKACAGQRQIVFVTGPAGVGKTRLIDTFLDSPAVRESASPVWIGRGRCVDQHGMREACMCVLDALEQLARRTDAQRLLELLRRAAPTWLVQMPWLIDDADTLRQSLLAARAERMLREFAALTEAWTTDVNLVLVLEDLHWSDASTVDLLSLLGQRREAARLLVIATYRPAEVAIQEHVLSNAVRALQMHRQCVELPVHELTQEDCEQYLEARFPGADFRTPLARVLHQRTDGNPLFMVALVEHLMARGWILETAPGWALSVSLEKIDLGVPDDARRMIETQFRSLGPADRSLLEAASVGGVEFAPRVIAAALGSDAADTEKRCERLARARWFLHAADTMDAPDGSNMRCYSFTHELYRQVVYADIPDAQRQRLHQRVGEELEAVYGVRAADIAAPLAAHFERSHDYGRTLRYLLAAATHARRRFANREAIDYLEEALALVPRLGDERERRRAELELRIALAPVLTEAHGFASAAVSVNGERAYELCAEVGRPEQLFQVLYALCHVYGVRADPALQPEMEQKLDDLARQLGTADSRLLADSILVRVAMETGRFSEARRLAEERHVAPRREKAAHPSFAYGADPLVASYCHYALALWMLGDGDRARTAMQASVAAAMEQGSAFTKTAALGQSCILEVFRRNVAAARALAEQVCSASKEHGFPYWNHMALAIRGWVAVQDGHSREGIAMLERAVAGHRATGARLFLTHMLAFLSEAYLLAANPDAALAAVNEGLAVADSTLDRSYWPELWRLKGEVLLVPSLGAACGRNRGSRERKTGASEADVHWREAERCLLRAVKLARDFEAKSLELRAATSLARAWHAHQQTAQARTVLDDICKWFGAKAESADLDAARLLLDDLSSVPPARPDAVTKRHASRSRH